VAQHETHQQGAAAKHGIGRYIIVWLLLMFLTLVTVLTGRMNLGWANIYVAMFIAVTKATLVVLFFMHLYDEGGVNRIVFVVSLLFVAVLILGVFGDLATRLPITLPNEGPVAPMHQTRHGGHHAPGQEQAPAPH
jgi:cytochrome c oxidase subunit IV